MSAENKGELLVPPQSAEAERAVLGSILIDAENSLSKVKKKKLMPEMFYDLRHKSLCESLYAMAVDGRAIDSLTIWNWINDRNELGSVGGQEYLDVIMSEVSVAAHVGHYCEIIIEKYVRRKVVAFATDLIEEAYGDVDGHALVASIPKRVMPLMENRTGSKTNRQILDSWYDRMLAIKNGEISNGLPLPWKPLDDLMCGLEPGLIVVGAEKSGGKTTFELNVCDYLAQDGCPIARAGLDMSVEQLLCRSVIHKAQVSLPRLKRGNARWNQMETVRECKDLVAGWPYHIVEGRTVDEICMEARMLKIKHDIQLLTVDFVQLVTTGNPHTDGNMNHLMGVVTLKLKALAFELNIPVMLLSQFSRGVARPGEKRRRPTLTDLRDSGNIEQNATQVLLISKALPEDWPAKGGSGDDKFDPLELPEDADRSYYRPLVFDLAKNQNGETGEVHMVMRPNYFGMETTTFGFLTMAEDLVAFKKCKAKEEEQSGVAGERLCDVEEEID